jgi:DNA mismatch endonuclease Vsr
MEISLKRKLVGGRFANVPPSTSRLMKAVRGKRNKTTEFRLRLALVRAGIRGWSMHATTLPGNPDFVFCDAVLAVFVDGCFWHGCPRCGHVPRTNRNFWSAKILRNRARDAETSRRLRRTGYRVVRFWEHELAEDLPRCVARIAAAIKKSTGR